MCVCFFIFLDFFVSTFSNFFVEILFFEFFIRYFDYWFFEFRFFKVLRILNFDFLISNFSTFRFFEFQIIFEFFSIFDFSDFGFFAQLLLSSLLVKFFGHFVKFATNRQVSSLPRRYDRYRVALFLPCDNPFLFHSNNPLCYTDNFDVAARWRFQIILSITHLEPDMKSHD